MDAKTLTRRTLPLALFLFQACGSTSPEVARSWSGTYQIATSLDTYHYETSYQPVPECGAPGALYCEHYVTPPAGASLSMNLTITTQPNGTLAATGSSSATNCVRCSAGIGALPSTAEYPFGAGSFVAADSTFSADLASAASLTFLSLQLSKGVVRGDSIFGNVRWGYSCCRGPSYYTGTFVGVKIKPIG